MRYIFPSFEIFGLLVEVKFGDLGNVRVTLAYSASDTFMYFAFSRNWLEAGSEGPLEVFVEGQQ